MNLITSAKAYANNEVAFIAWNLAGPIQDCAGFEITRIYPDTNEETVLPSWVPFQGQSNPQWLPQTTSVWPVQKLFWRDLTARKRRAGTDRRPADVTVKYRIRPLVHQKEGLTSVVPPPNANPYTGQPIPLSYADEGMETNPVLITTKVGDIQAAFTNGILSAQWLSQVLASAGQANPLDTLKGHINTPGDKIRQYLTGDVLATLKTLLNRALMEPGAHVHMALYELSDMELKDLIVANKQSVRLILSNTGQEGTPPMWDATNQAFRPELHNTPGLEIYDRMFNNEHIGHNKFAVYVDANGNAQAVMTGSTNWTPTGLCAQSNNAVIIESAQLAGQYLEYWNDLLADTQTFAAPASANSSTSNVQRSPLRTKNATPLVKITLNDGTRITLWRSPNTTAELKKHVLPPDLADVYAAMERSKDLLLFAVFLPGESGKDSVIEKAIALANEKSELMVYGAVSDPTAMPNYVRPTSKKNAPSGGTGSGSTSSSGNQVSQPSTYDQGNTHIVCASELTQQDIVGNFEKELLKAGHAIIHDKVVVVDPLSDNGCVILGSHNLGYKASYENDENLLIVEGNPRLSEAYAVHVLDLYDHYRFRAAQKDMLSQNKNLWDGFLTTDSSWLNAWFADKGKLARYFG